MYLAIWLVVRDEMDGDNVTIEPVSSPSSRERGSSTSRSLSWPDQRHSRGNYSGKRRFAIRFLTILPLSSRTL